MRLLDFTRRLAVATHFATKEPSPDHPVIWAVDGYRLEAAWRAQVTASDTELVITAPRGNCEAFNELYSLGRGGPAAMFVEPQARNLRQELQDGLFLVGLDLSASLEENLFGCLGYLPGDVNPTIGARGLPTGPVGFNETPLVGSAVRRVKDALVLQIMLDLDAEDVRNFLEEEAVSDETLGLT